MTVVAIWLVWTGALFISIGLARDARTLSDEHCGYWVFGFALLTLACIIFTVKVLG